MPLIPYSGLEDDFSYMLYSEPENHLHYQGITARFHENKLVVFGECKTRENLSPKNASQLHILNLEFGRNSYNFTEFWEMG